MSESILKQRLKACTIDEIERLKLIKDLNINEAILKDYFDSYPILTENANTKQINFENYKLLFENGNFDLIKLIFKYNNYDNKAYGDYFGSILEYIIDDYKSNLMPKYDAQKIFGLILEIFKEMFQNDFKDHYREFMVKYKYKLDVEYFKNENYKDFLLNKFSSKLSIEKLFTKLAHDVLEHKWLDVIKTYFDTCLIELDNDVNFFIASPIESVLPYKSLHNNQISPDNNSWFKHYFQVKHPLYRLRKLDDEELLGHKFVYTVLHEKWVSIGRQTANFEYAIYVAFVIFYSLNSLRLSKEYSMPIFFDNITLALVVIILVYELIEIACLKFYYFISFNHYFEWINMALCLLSIKINDNITLKTSLYSFSIAYAYLCLIFRTEKSVLFGTYAYTFRKILLKSFRVLPIVIALYFGFFFAFKIRSRFISNPGEDHDAREISAFDSYLSIGMVKLSIFFMGNVEMNDMGLNAPQNVSTSETFINYFMTDAFIFLMPIFLFNLFIGVAVGEASDMVRKGQYHLLKVRIDMLLRLFYIYSLFGYFGIKWIRNKQHKKYLWQTPKHPKPVWSWIKYKIGKLGWLLKEKLSNTQWTLSYKLELDGTNDLSDDDKNLNNKVNIIDIE